MKRNCGTAHLGILIVVIVVGLGMIGYLAFSKSISENGLQETIKTLTRNERVSIPQEIIDNKFGFPSGGPGDVDIYSNFGIGWVRPHPGPFQWGLMQSKENTEIDFSTTDRFVKGYQEAEFGIQVTLFPFADWDQIKHPDSKNCRVSEKDIFAQPDSKPDDKIDYEKKELEKKGIFEDEKFAKDIIKFGEEKKPEENVQFLPDLRCNPYDWEGYLVWVKAVVERYDGDGVDDMRGLKIPIKYWEVMNEPDLNADHLDFYQGTGADYAQLLVKTAKTIHETDPEAKILIAGAAGGNNQFLNFYRSVFKNKEARTAFDIGNVHCISNDHYESYNVEPYQKMLAEFGIDVPVWVTEAEALVSLDRDINASQTYASTQKALQLGAEKIFYAHQKFDRGPDKPGLPESHLKLSDYKVQLDGSNPIEVFQTITQLK